MAAESEASRRGGLWDEQLSAEVIECIVVALVAGGKVPLEGLRGFAKTLELTAHYGLISAQLCGRRRD